MEDFENFFDYFIPRGCPLSIQELEMEQSSSTSVLSDAKYMVDVIENEEEEEESDDSDWEGPFVYNWRAKQWVPMEEDGTNKKKREETGDIAAYSEEYRFIIIEYLDHPDIEKYSHLPNNSNYFVLEKREYHQQV